MFLIMVNEITVITMTKTEVTTGSDRSTFGDEIKKHEMGRACNMHESYEKCM
jgi:hypothetical protein